VTTPSKLATLTVIALSAVSPLFAQEPPAPKPAKEMDQLKVYDGAWTCEGSVPESPLGPARKTSTTVKFHSDLDGMWLSLRVDEAASKDNPHPYKGVGHMGYDAAAKKFLILWTDNTGGWAAQTSSGWEQDRMIWVGEGSMSGGKVSARDTFTKQGADLQHLGELQIEGKWVTVQDEVCRHAAGKK
jgi:hypothetical protein